MLRIEDGLQRGQGLEGRVGPRSGVGLLAQQRVDFPGQLLARGHGVAVAGQGHLVLPLARDVPFLAGQLHVLAHGQARGRLAEEVHGGARQRIDPAGQAHVDAAAGDGVGDDRDRPQPGDAVGGHGMGLGPLIGSPASKTSSRARLGFRGSGVIVPKTTDSISSGSIPLRSSMPRVAWTAMARESISAKALPDLMKGVRPPATMATRLGVIGGVPFGFGVGYVS